MCKTPIGANGCTAIARGARCRNHRGPSADASGSGDTMEPGLRFIAAAARGIFDRLR